MALGRLGLVFRAPGREPGASFLAGQVLTRLLVRRPSRVRFLLQALTGFLAIDVLPDCLTHQFMSRPIADRGETAQPILQFVVDSYGNCRSRPGNFPYSKVLHANTSS